MMDALRNQIIERCKVLGPADRGSCQVQAMYLYKPEGTDTEAVDSAASGMEDESEIPEAKHPAQEPLKPTRLNCRRSIKGRNQAGQLRPLRRGANFKIRAPRQIGRKLPEANQSAPSAKHAAVARKRICLLIVIINASGK